MYLANDVIQISKKKGPEYGEEFEKVLKKVFAHIGELCRHEEKTIGVLGRTLNIWEERGVYKKELIEEFRNALNRESKTTDSNGNTADAKSKTDASANGNTEKRHRDRSRSSDRKRQRSSKSRDEPAAVVIEVPSQFVLSPRLPAGKWIVAVAEYITSPQTAFLFFFLLRIQLTHRITRSSSEPSRRWKILRQAML